MGSYYDREEDIAWGCLTLEEIVNELRVSPRKIERSVSDLGEYKSSKEDREVLRSLSKNVPKRSSSLLLTLDDTVKEMELALKYGLDYLMPDEEAKMRKEEKLEEGEKRAKGTKTLKKKYGHVISPVGLYIKSSQNKENLTKKPMLKIKAKV